MISIVLFLAMWPFHAKPHYAKPQTQEQQDADASEGQCEKEGDLWLFLGEDGVLAYSSISCGKAYRNWINTHTDPIRMSRA